MRISRRESANTIGAGLRRTVERSPFEFLGGGAGISIPGSRRPTCTLRWQKLSGRTSHKIVRWNLIDRRRVAPRAARSLAAVEDTVAFRASLQGNHGGLSRNVESDRRRRSHIRVFSSRQNRRARLLVERYAEKDQHVAGGGAVSRVVTRGGGPGIRTPKPTTSFC